MREISRTINAQIWSLCIEHSDGLGLSVAVSSTIDRGPCALERVAVITITIGANLSIIGGAWSTVAVVAHAQATNRSQSWDSVTLYIHHISGEGGEFRSGRVIDGNLLNVLREVLVAIVNAVCTADDVLLITSRGENHILVGHSNLSVTVVHGLSVESITRCIDRNRIAVHVACEGGIIALHCQIGWSQSELGGCEVRRHHDLLNRCAVTAHVIGRIVDDVIVGASARKRGAIDVHMAQLAVISSRSQANAVEVLIRAVSPEVTLNGVHLQVAEARSNLILDVNALVIADRRSVSTAVRCNCSPRTDDAVAAGADAVDNIVGVVQARISQITVVSIRSRSHSCIARIEVHIAEAIYVEGDIRWGRHRHFWLGVVLDRDGLHMVRLVAEAIRGHPCAVQNAAAARCVRSCSLSYELNTYVNIVAI